MGSNPLAKLAETEYGDDASAATEAFMPGAKPGRGRSSCREPDADAESDELDELREQMAAMQKKLDELGK